MADEIDIKEHGVMFPGHSNVKEEFDVVEYAMEYKLEPSTSAGVDDMIPDSTTDMYQEHGAACEMTRAADSPHMVTSTQEDAAPPAIANCIILGSKPTPNCNIFNSRATANCIIVGSRPNASPSIDYQHCTSATVPLIDWGQYLRDSRTYCRDCRTLFATVNALDAHKMHAHSFLVATGRQERAVPPPSPPVTVRESDRIVKTKCEFCEKRFSDEKELIRHMYDHLNTSIQCDRCPETFFSQQKLEEHKLVHSSEAVELFYRCHVCGLPSSKRTLYKRHMERFHNTVPENYEMYPLDLTCPHCERSSWTSLKSFREHLRTHSQFHLKVKPAARVKSKPEFVTKLRTKLTKTKASNCKIETTEASKSNMEGGELNLDDDSIVVPKPSLFRCSKCDVHFLNSSMAVSHYNTCNGETIDSYRCVRCNLHLKLSCQTAHNNQHKFADKFTALEISDEDIRPRILRSGKHKCHQENSSKCRICNISVSKKAYKLRMPFHSSTNSSKESADESPVLKLSPKRVALEKNDYKFSNTSRRDFNLSPKRPGPTKHIVKEKHTRLIEKSPDHDLNQTDKSAIETSRTYSTRRATRQTRKNDASIQKMTRPEILVIPFGEKHPETTDQEDSVNEEEQTAAEMEVDEQITDQNQTKVDEQVIYQNQTNINKQVTDQNEAKVDVPVIDPNQTKINEQVTRASTKRAIETSRTYSTRRATRQTHNNDTPTIDDDEDKIDECYTRDTDADDKVFTFYQCRTCHLCLTTKRNDHFCDTKTDSRIICVKCGLKFSKKLYRRHKRFHTNPKFVLENYKIIPFSADTEKTLKGRNNNKKEAAQDVNERTDDNRPATRRRGYMCTFYQCSSCKICVHDEENIKRHTCVDQDFNRYKCDECGLYLRKSVQDMHQKSHELNPEFVYENFKIIPFSNKAAEANHAKTYTRKDYTFYQCNACSFCVNDRMDQHSCATKHRTKRVTCKLCGLYISKLILNKHLSAHKFAPSFVRENFTILPFSPKIKESQVNDTASDATRQGDATDEDTLKSVDDEDLVNTHRCETASMSTDAENKEVTETDNFKFYQCTKCSLSLRYYRLALRHKCITRPRSLKFTCRKCGLYLDSRNFKSHLTDHKNNRDYNFEIVPFFSSRKQGRISSKCPECELIIGTHYYLKHLETHDQDPSITRANSEIIPISDKTIHKEAEELLDEAEKPTQHENSAKDEVLVPPLKCNKPIFYKCTECEGCLPEDRVPEHYVNKLCATLPDTQYCEMCENKFPYSQEHLNLHRVLNVYRVELTLISIDNLDDFFDKINKKCVYQCYGCKTILFSRIEMEQHKDSCSITEINDVTVCRKCRLVVCNDEESLATHETRHQECSEFVNEHITVVHFDSSGVVTDTKKTEVNSNIQKMTRPKILVSPFGEKRPETTDQKDVVNDEEPPAEEMEVNEQVTVQSQAKINEQVTDQNQTKVDEQVTDQNQTKVDEQLTEIKNIRRKQKVLSVKRMRDGKSVSSAKECKKKVYYKCKNCNVVYLSRKQCVAHFKSHVRIPDHDFVACKICGKNFLLDSLREHMSHHKMMELTATNLLTIIYSTKYLPDEIGLIRRTKEFLSRDQKVDDEDHDMSDSGSDVDSNSSNVHACELCTKKYKTQLARDLHISLDHLDELMECQICGKTFHKSILNDLHLCVRDGTFKCCVCGISYPTEWQSAHAHEHATAQAKQ